MAVMFPNRFDAAADEFFAGLTPAEGVRGTHRRLAWLVQVTKAPMSIAEAATEDQVVATFMDALGSVQDRHLRFAPRHHRLTSPYFSLLTVDGLHGRSSAD